MISTIMVVGRSNHILQLNLLRAEEQFGPPLSLECQARRPILKIGFPYLLDQCNFRWLMPASEVYGTICCQRR